MIPLARIAGIRITLDPSWFVIFLLVAWSLAVGYLPEQLPTTPPVLRWTLAAALALALFASVLAHELSHALVARARRVNVDEIMLFLFGGVAKLRGEPRDALSELLIAAAGPLLSIALGLGLLAAEDLVAGTVPPALQAGLWWLGVINVALALFNLVPGFPLDGGRILRGILWWRSGDFERATIGAARTGQVIAGLLIAVGVLFTLTSGNLSWLWEVVIGWFLWSAATRSIRLARLRDAVEGLTVGELLTDRVPAVRADQDVRVAIAQAAALSDSAELAVIERDGTLAGVVTRSALVEAAEIDPRRSVREIATPPDPEQVLTRGSPAEEIVGRLAGLEGRLPLIVENGRLIGTVDSRALVAALQSAGDEAAPEDAGGP